MLDLITLLLGAVLGCCIGYPFGFRHGSRYVVKMLQEDFGGDEDKDE